MLCELPDEIQEYITTFIGPICKKDLKHIPICLQSYVVICPPHKIIRLRSICMLPYSHDSKLMACMEHILFCIHENQLYNKGELQSIHFRQSVSNDHIPYIKNALETLGFTFSHFCCSGNGMMFS
jgi:hypothetical protein